MTVICVRWDVRRYLEHSGRCVSLTEAEMRELLPALPTSSDMFFADDDDDGAIVNVSVSGTLPTGPQWRFFAITDNPALVRTTADIVSGRAAYVVYLALCCTNFVPVKVEAVASADKVRRIQDSSVHLASDEDDVFIQDSPSVSARKAATVRDSTAAQVVASDSKTATVKSIEASASETKTTTALATQRRIGGMSALKKLKK